MTKLSTTLLAATVTLGLLARAAAADVYALAEPTDRTGLVLGATIDGGHIGCETQNGDDCGNGVHPAGGFSLYAGTMIMPALAITGELWGMAHQDGDVTASQVLATANLRAWVAPRLWLQGGFGFARSKVTNDGPIVMTESVSDTVPAATAAIGVELVHARTFALDLQLRGGSGFYRGDARVWNTAIGVGATLF
jgi:hypothetical protein